MIIVGDFNTLLSIMDRITILIGSRELEQHCKLIRPNILHIQNTLLTTAEHKFSSSAYGIFSRIDHVRPQKRLNIF